METVVLSYILFIFIFIFISTTIDCKRCFSMTKHGKKIWYNETAVLSDLPRSREKPNIAPESPTYLKRTGSRLTWKPATGYTTIFLTNFLLLIEQDITRDNQSLRVTKRLLLGPFNNTKYKVQRVFSYDCIDLEPTAERATFTVWSLSNKTRGDDGSWAYNTNDKKTITWKVPDQKKIQKRRELDDCIHKSNILGVTLIRINRTALMPVVYVSNQHRANRVEFHLNRNNETIRTWINTTQTTKNITKFHEILTVGSGQYVLKARKQCPGSTHEESYHQSSLCILNDITTESFTTAKDGDVVSVPIEYTFGTLAVTVLSIVSGSVALVVILVLVTRCGKTKKVFGTSAVTTSLLKGSQRENGPVAVIYANDSIQHRTRVYKLCAMLQIEGIDALAIDEHTRNKEMFENWIAEGEEISNCYRNFVFVVSPDLVNVCRIPGKQNTAKSEYIPQSATPVGHSKLPLVILNSIKSQALHFDTKNVQTVYFKNDLNQSSEELIDLCREFTASHRSVLHAETFRFTVKHDIFVKNKAFVNFMALYKNETSPRCIFDSVTCL